MKIKMVLVSTCTCQIKSYKSGTYEGHQDTDEKLILEIGVQENGLTMFPLTSLMRMSDVIKANLPAKMAKHELECLIDMIHTIQDQVMRMKMMEGSLITAGSHSSGPESVSAGSRFLNNLMRQVGIPEERMESLREGFLAEHPEIKSMMEMLDDHARSADGDSGNSEAENGDGGNGDSSKSNLPGQYL